MQHESRSRRPAFRSAFNAAAVAAVSVLVMARSFFVVLVVAAPPDARLVAPLGSAVEPRIHAPDGVYSTRIGGIGVVDDAVLEYERAQARPIARVRGRVGSAYDCELS